MIPPAWTKPIVSSAPYVTPRPQFRIRPVGAAIEDDRVKVEISNRQVRDGDAINAVASPDAVRDASVSGLRHPSPTFPTSSASVVTLRIPTFISGPLKYSDRVRR